MAAAVVSWWLVVRDAGIVVVTFVVVSVVAVACEVVAVASV